MPEENAKENHEFMETKLGLKWSKHGSKFLQQSVQNRRKLDPRPRSEKNQKKTARGIAAGWLDLTPKSVQNHLKRPSKNHQKTTPKKYGNLVEQSPTFMSKWSPRWCQHLSNIDVKIETEKWSNKNLRNPWKSKAPKHEHHYVFIGITIHFRKATKSRLKKLPNNTREWYQNERKWDRKELHKSV